MKELTIQEVFNNSTNFYNIYMDENGRKVLEIDAFFYKGDDYVIMECEGATCYLDELEDDINEQKKMECDKYGNEYYLFSEYDVDDRTCLIQEHLLWPCNEYESETTPEEVQSYINEYPNRLRLGNVNVDTPCGKYVDFE